MKAFFIIYSCYAVAELAFDMLESVVGLQFMPKSLAVWTNESMLDTGNSLLRRK